MNRVIRIERRAPAGKPRGPGCEAGPVRPAGRPAGPPAFQPACMPVFFFFVGSAAAS